MKKIKDLSLAFLLATAASFAIVAVADRAMAQSPAAAPPPSPPGTSVLLGYAPLSVGATSSRVALPTSGPAGCALTISNYGVKDAFFVLGGSTVSATTSSTPIRAGKSIAVWVGANTYLAAICGGSDTTTLDLYQGNGPVTP